MTVVRSNLLQRDIVCRNQVGPLLLTQSENRILDQVKSAPTHLFSYSNADFFVGTAIAATMIVAFCAFSSGLSLILTFVPGVVFAYVLFVIIGRSGSIHGNARLGTLFFVAIAVQALHCAEEYLTGFPSKFPVAYGGEPFSDTAFLFLNFCAYIAFAICGNCVFYQGSQRLLIPVLFFVVYGTWGNAMSHLTWCALSGGYFPGAGTAVAYLFIGPLLIGRILEHRRTSAMFLVAVAVTLIAAAVFGFDPSEIRLE